MTTPAPLQEPVVVPAQPLGPGRPSTRYQHDDGATRGRLVPVLGLALLTAVLRLPYLTTPLSADESGFATIARQWRPGASLYGRYWVDRPPLLLELFGLAGGTGGPTALRLTGCLAASLTVLSVGFALHRLAGSRAATRGSAVACALLVSPLLGTTLVDGELLAAPFIAAGVCLTLVAVGGPPASRGSEGTARRAVTSSWSAAGAGACAMAALLVKQNMADVLVFAGVLGFVSWRLGGLHLRQLRRLALLFGIGAATTATLVLGVAALRGTGPGGVLYAMYPFRWQAMGVMGQHATALRLGRLQDLGVAELLSGGPILVATLAVGLLRRRSEGSVAWRAASVATLAVAAYAVASIVAGGSYWSHYLVQLVVPTALAAGLLPIRARWGRRAVALVLVACGVAWTTGLSYRVETPGQHVGAAVRDVAEPGDGLVSVLGDADIPRVAGLDSPYPYLWSLPARTLDPRLHELATVLEGPRAPTWLVLRGPRTVALVDHDDPGPAFRGRYHLVARICGRAVYLRNGRQRGTPPATGDCTSPMSPWFAALTGGPSGAPSGSPAGSTSGTTPGARR